MRVAKTLHGARTRRTNYDAYKIVGKKVKFIPAHQPKKENTQFVYGFVRWVHPKGRFALVEYKTAKSSCYMRECLLLPEALDFICK